MKKKYSSAPLPFVGQKRKFAGAFRKVLRQYPDNTVFVDLFGGSGLLSYIAKSEKPSAVVVYNDFDNFRRRLENIPRTNALLHDLRTMTLDYPRHKLLPETVHEAIIERISKEEASGFVDYITISSSLLFSMKYCKNLDELRKESFYNNVRKADYPQCLDYLNGIEVVSCDYRELFKHYKDVPNVVFLVDPPYLSTDVGTYTMRWGLADYLDVLTVLCGTKFIYFTSNKSNIIELCEWMDRNKHIGNPFEKANRMEVSQTMNYSAHYTDIMLYNEVTMI